MRHEDRYYGKGAREPTVAESVTQFLKLLELFAPQVQAADGTFQPERETYMINLQKKLQRFAKWEMRTQSGKTR